MTEFPYFEIENKICYKFRDRALLFRAFTHNSYPDSERNYQNLEFLGDSIVGFVIAELLYSAYPNIDEGELTKLRAAIVSRTPLANAVSALELERYMLLGAGEARQGVNGHLKVRADLYEAICAAIYIDSNSLCDVKEFIKRTLEPAIDDAHKALSSFDAKSDLNEYAQKKGYSVEYSCSVEGPPHEPLFTASVCVNSQIIGVGTGSSKRDAEQQAAKEAYAELRRCAGKSNGKKTQK